MSKHGFSMLAVAAMLLAVGSGLIQAETPKEVTVINDAGDPVPVTASVPGMVKVEVKERGELFQEKFDGSYSSGDRSWRAESEIVPEGKRKVIEFFTLVYGSYTSEGSQGACSLYVMAIPGCQGSIAGQIDTTHYVPTIAGSSFGGDGVEMSNALRTLMFLDEGQSLCVICPLPEDHSGIFIGGGRVSIAGHLVDMPAPSQP